MSLQPPAQPQVVPWLAQPLPVLVWAGLVVAALATLAGAVRVRRSPEPCPLSPRWLAVTLVVTSGLFAAMSFGGSLLHPAAACAASALLVGGAAVTWAGWHAESTPARFAQSTGLSFTLGVTLALAAVPLLYARGTEWRMGLNLGEALACLLPAAGVPLAVLLLLPPDHPRTQRARHAVTAFAGAFLASLIVMTAGVTLAVSTPLPFESPLAERYIYLNATLAMSAMLTGLCSLSVGAMSWLHKRWQGVAILAALLVGVFAVNSLCAKWTATPAFGQHATRSVISFTGGLLLGLVAWSQIRWRPFVRAVLCVVALVIAVRTAVFAPASSGAFAPAWNLAITALGFLTSAVTAQPEAGAERRNAAQSPGEPVFVASAIAVAGMVAVVLAIRSSLVYQSTEFSRHFRYDRLVNTSDDFRREAVGHPHALRMGGGRFAWVLPQATWWTPDYAWRDALIVTDRSKPIPPNPETTGPYFGVSIVDEQGKPGDADFKDARFIAITEPAIVGRRNFVARTTPIRTATPTDLADWAGVSITNPRLWIGLICAGVLSWWCLRSPRPLHHIGLVLAAALLITAAAEGLAAATALLIGTAAALALPSVRRDDRWRSPTAVGLLLAVALAVLPIIIRLGDR